MSEFNLPRLPLESPRWRELLSNGIPPASEAPRLLREIEAAASFGEAWTWLYEGPLQLGEVINEATYAILPHIVTLANKKEPRTLADVWFRVATIVANLNYPGIHSKPLPIPADLEAGFRAALEAAEVLALRCFCAAEWSEQASDLAIACLALSRHPVGCQVQQVPYPPSYGGEFVRFHCWECEAEEIWFAHAGEGVAVMSDDGSCPATPDPSQPEPQAPPVPDLSSFWRGGHPWGLIAEALDKPPGEILTLQHGSPLPEKFFRRFGDHLHVAATVAGAGVPKQTPNRAALCLLGAMVALSGAFDWAARLLRLAGLVRCPECGRVDSWANCLANIPIRA